MCAGAISPHHAAAASSTAGTMVVQAQAPGASSKADTLLPRSKSAGPGAVSLTARWSITTTTAATPHSQPRHQQQPPESPIATHEAAALIQPQQLHSAAPPTPRCPPAVNASAEHDGPTANHSAGHDSDIEAQWLVSSSPSQLAASTPIYLFKAPSRGRSPAPAVRMISRTASGASEASRRVGAAVAGRMRGLRCRLARLACVAQPAVA